VSDAPSTSLEVRAEVLKLARLLGREPSSLAYLEQAEAAALAALREQVTEVLFASGDGVLRRLAQASRLLPVALVAQLAERSFGPVLSARVAGLIDAQRAVEMAGRLPVPFLADIAVELDPRRAREVIAGIPPGQIAAITAELTRRREYVTMGRFVGHLPDAALAAALGEMDSRALLEVALVIENKERLADVVDLLGEARLHELIETAEKAGLADEALGLLDHLAPGQRAAVARWSSAEQRRIA
jgi:hypothetical protein